MAVQWNCTVGDTVYESAIDPIGFLFIVVFGFVMGIQLFGMFLHRVFTILQILSVTVVCSLRRRGGGSGGGGSGDDDVTPLDRAKAIEAMKSFMMASPYDAFEEEESDRCATTPFYQNDDSHKQLVLFSVTPKNLHQQAPNRNDQNKRRLRGNVIKASRST